MYVTIGTLLFVLLSFEFIKYLSRRNWTLIYSTYGYDEYFQVIGKLKSAGIKYKLADPAVDFRVDRFKDHTQYQIYVKKEEEHEAVKVLHKK